MAAWAEAAWIIERIQANFDFKNIVSEVQDLCDDVMEEIQNTYAQATPKKFLIIVNSESQLPPSDQVGRIALIKKG